MKRERSRKRIITRVRINKALADAKVLIEAGRLKEAHALLRKVDHPEAARLAEFMALVMATDPASEAAR
jgi:hypothetical protein